MKKVDSLTGKALTDLIASKRFYHITIACMAIAILILVLAVTSKKTEVVVMPPDYWEAIAIRGNVANEAFAAGHGLAIAMMIGNASDRNIDFVTDSVVRMLAPNLRAQIADLLRTEAQVMKSRRIRQTFVVDDVMYKPDQNIFWVWGQKHFSMPGGQSHTQRFTYEMQIVPRYGHPKITHFDAYPGMPTFRDPTYKANIQPYLTRDLKLARYFANPDIKHDVSSNTDEAGDELIDINHGSEDQP